MQLIPKFKKKEGDSDSPTKPKEVKQILDEQIDAGLKEFNRSNSGLFISAFAAGMEVGFSILLMGTVYTLFHGDTGDNYLHFLLSMCYPLGFIFVIIGRSELFTEHTALAILPVLSRRVSLKRLFGLWGIVYLGNLAGGYVFSFLITYIGQDTGAVSHEAFSHIAHEMTKHDWSTILLSALLAGWMMGLLGWLVTSAQDTISRILVVILITFTIGMGGLHHCIVGSIEVFSGFLIDPHITLLDYGRFQLWATVGNALGGAVFVAILKFSHVRLH